MQVCGQSVDRRNTWITTQRSCGSSPTDRLYENLPQVFPRLRQTVSRRNLGAVSITFHVTLRGERQPHQSREDHTKLFLLGGLGRYTNEEYQKATGSNNWMTTLSVMPTPPTMMSRPVVGGAEFVNKGKYGVWNYCRD